MCQFKTGDTVVAIRDTEMTNIFGHTFWVGEDAVFHVEEVAGDILKVKPIIGHTKHPRSVPAKDFEVEKNLSEVDSNDSN